MRFVSRLVPLTAVAALAGAIGFAGPAAAASIGSCVKSPSDGNCTGAPIVRHDACWDGSFVVQGENTDFVYAYLGWRFEVTLRYSPQCRANFAVVEMTQQDPTDITHSPQFSVSAKVRRVSGPDGGYVMLRSGWQLLPDTVAAGVLLISPLVYSPDNPAQACISMSFNDNAACTSQV